MGKFRLTTTFVLAICIHKNMNPSEIETFILLKNNKPLEEYCGLSATEMHNLLYDPFGEKSILSFRKDITNVTLDQIPFFRLTEEFIKLIQKEKQIKLTPSGALPKKTLLELYSHKLILESEIENGIIKPSREQDFVSIQTMRYNSQACGIVEEIEGKLSLTILGDKFLNQENRIEFFKTVFKTYTTRYNWSSNDEFTEEPVGELGFGYSMYLLKKFGDKRNDCLTYAAKYFHAFPKLFNCFELPMTHRIVESGYCYNLRTFERFFEWFGLVKIYKSFKEFDSIDAKVKSSEIFKQIFKIE